MNLRVVLFLIVALPLQAQFTFAPINVPGAVSTQARGLNVNGEIAGFYQTVACTNYAWQVPNCPTKGFKFMNGSYIKLMVSGSLTTAIMGLNDYGDLVGFYSKTQTGCAHPVYHGFIWYHTNVVRTIDAPGTDACGAGNPVTVPFGINKAGTVVGGIWGVNTGTGSFPSGGWVYSAGTFSAMDPENAPTTNPCCWSVNGIANNGFISGQVFQADFWMAWFKNAADEDFYEYHSAQSTGGDTYGTGVNSSADTVGYSPGQGGFFAKHIELNEGTNDSGEIQPQGIVVDYPGVPQFRTFPFSVNDVRGVAGMYVDNAGNTHGFIAKPNF
jgi:hypothetical protein